MRVKPLLTSVWPGLTHAWLLGQWIGLLTACAFAVLLNSALLVSFAWPELVSRGAVAGLWTAVALFWLVSIWWSYREFPATGQEAGELGQQDLFLQAQGEYLKGNWFAAETLIKRMLKSQPGDVDARLMLVALFRHTRRTDEAAAQLQLLQRSDGAGRWHFEIEDERRQLDRIKSETTAADSATLSTDQSEV